MIPALCVAQPSFIPTNNTLYNVLQSLGLTSGLQTCLDASDAASYSGSGQTWIDETGNGYSFFLGTTGSGEASDPTFNGTAGSQAASTYWSVAGAQWFTLNQSNPAWVTQMHKAGAKQTILMWTYVNNVTSTSQAFASVGDANAGGATSGFTFAGNSGVTLRSMFVNATNAGATVYFKESTGTATNNAWNFLSTSMDMTAGNVIFDINGATETYSSQSYSSPSSGNAAATIQIAATGIGEFPDVTGGRWGGVAVWNIALTAAQLASIFTATRAKFGV